jgi:hypothetical protein
MFLLGDKNITYGRGKREKRDEGNEEARPVPDENLSRTRTQQVESVHRDTKRQAHTWFFCPFLVLLPVGDRKDRVDRN